MLHTSLVSSIPHSMANSSQQLRFFVYQPDRDYFLGPRHQGQRLPTDSLCTITDAETADYFLLPEDLRRLQIDLGIGAVTKFIEALPHFSLWPERHICWSSHDDPCVPHQQALICKASTSRREPGRWIAVPYLVEDLLPCSHFCPSRITHQTCFVGYPGSSPLREQLLKAVAAAQQLTSQLDLAPKFHGHLEQTTRNTRRQLYLETMASSLTVLCPRGDGMNSIRFFETLSMGRIPVLIADDCVLPFEKHIPYHRFVISIPEQEVHNAPDLIKAWIDNKSTEELLHRCQEARRYWEQMLSPSALAAALTLELTPRTALQQAGGVSSFRHHEALHAYQTGDLQRADRLLTQGLQEHPDDAEALRYAALVRNESGQFAATIELLSASSVDFPAKQRLLGEAYQQTGQWEQAAGHLVQAHKEEPHNPALLMNLGVVYSKLGRWHEALKLLNQAADLHPESARIAMNRGCVLQSLQQTDQAIAAFRRALQLDPNYGTAQWNLAQLLLSQGELEQGFELFEARFAKADPVPLPPLNVPHWQGEPLRDKCIIVLTEQAFGDTIQFARYLPLLAQQGTRVILYNHLQPLQELLRSVPGVSLVIGDAACLPDADYQIPLLSLPRLFKTSLADIPARMIPYLAPRPDKLARWREKAGQTTGLKIGLCWHGRPEPDPLRSAQLLDFAPLAHLNNTVFYSLQVGAGAEQVLTHPPGMRLIDLTSEISDFEDTASLIINLDLVISIDTAVAHLAGALGRPVFTMLPYAADWRWMLHRHDCPWYPTMRLFRQEKPGDWSGPVSAILALISHDQNPATP